MCCVAGGVYAVEVLPVMAARIAELEREAKQDGVKTYSHNAHCDNLAAFMFAFGLLVGLVLGFVR